MKSNSSIACQGLGVKTYYYKALRHTIIKIICSHTPIEDLHLRYSLPAGNSLLRCGACYDRYKVMQNITIHAHDTIK